VILLVILNDEYKLFLFNNNLYLKKNIKHIFFTNLQRKRLNTNIINLVLKVKLKNSVFLFETNFFYLIFPLMPPDIFHLHSMQLNMKKYPNCIKLS